MGQNTTAYYITAQPIGATNKCHHLRKESLTVYFSGQWRTLVGAQWNANFFPVDAKDDTKHCSSAAPVKPRPQTIQLSAVQKRPHHMTADQSGSALQTTARASQHSRFRNIHITWPCFQWLSVTNQSFEAVPTCHLCNSAKWLPDVTMEVCECGIASEPGHISDTLLQTLRSLTCPDCFVTFFRNLTSTWAK